MIFARRCRYDADGRVGVITETMVAFVVVATMTIFRRRGAHAARHDGDDG
jgi:hypothetical protein